MSDISHDQDWPVRAWSLAALGAVMGLAVHWLVNAGPRGATTDDPSRLAMAALLVTGGLAFAYTVERGRILSTAVFAVVAGAIAGSTVYWNGSPFSHDGGEPWRLVCALLTVAIAAPLFAAWRDVRTVRALPAYGATHNRAWTNVVLWVTSWGFVLIVWLLANLLGELFGLIGLTWLKDLLRESWFGLTLAGAAVGAGIGVLRDRETVLGTLQRVATTVLAVLAPVLAIGLVLFLVSALFTGLKPLWEATRNTTPILIACVIGALILANAVLRDAPEEEPRAPVLRWSAMLLGCTMLPLGIIAAISTGLRIRQYGLTPDRLWAVVFGAIACAYGVAYLVALARGRMTWGKQVRPANLHLAIGLCVLAFLLSTPLFSFDAMSTRDQVTRLKDGRTPANRFDWRALRWDFGQSGRTATAELAKTGSTAEIRRAAGDALASEARYDTYLPDPSRKSFEERVVILPKPVPVPDELRRKIAMSSPCGWGGDERCVVIYTPDAAEAVVVSESESAVIRRGKSGWGDGDTVQRAVALAMDNPKVSTKQLLDGPVTIGTVMRRQVFVNGKPVGQPFE